MAEFLVIRLGGNPERSADWIVVDGNGARCSPPVTGPLAEAAKDVGDRTVIALVPDSTSTGCEVIGHRVIRSTSTAHGASPSSFKKETHFGCFFLGLSYLRLPH